MALWLAQGETSEGNPAKNTTLLSNHLLRKHVRIGALGLDHLIRYDVTFVVPPGEHHTRAPSSRRVTGYMPWEFQKFWTLESDGTSHPSTPAPASNLARSSSQRTMRCSRWESTRQIADPGYPRHTDTAAGPSTGPKVVKWNCVFRVSDPRGLPPGRSLYRMYIAVGTLDDVRSASPRGTPRRPARSRPPKQMTRRSQEKRPLVTRCLESVSLFNQLTRPAADSIERCYMRFSDAAGSTCASGSPAIPKDRASRAPISRIVMPS